MDLNITLDEIREYIKLDDERRIVFDRSTIRLNEERRILERSTFCSTRPGAIQANLPKLMTENISSQQFYTCSSELQNNTDRVLSHLIVQKLFSNVHKIGSSSAFGDVYLNSNANPTIVKVAKRSAPLIHEIFAGLFAINHMSTYIPNFMRTYGYLKCGASYTPPNEKKPVSWCLPGDEMYLVAEYIPGDTIANKIKDGMTGESFAHIYLQVLLSLRASSQLIGFTHNDLHGSNVMVTDCNSMRRVTYPDFSISRGKSRRNITIATNKIAKIIDFGFSRVELADEGVFSGAIAEDIAVDSTNKPIGDAYRLLFQAYPTAIRSKNNSVKTIMYAISRYFTEEDMSIFSSTAGKMFHGYPFKRGNIDDLIQHVIDVADQFGLNIGIEIDYDSDANVEVKDMELSQPLFGNWTPDESSSAGDLYIANRLGLFSNSRLRLILRRDLLKIGQYNESLRDIKPLGNIGPVTYMANIENAMRILTTAISSITNISMLINVYNEHLNGIDPRIPGTQDNLTSSMLLSKKAAKDMIKRIEYIRSNAVSRLVKNDPILKNVISVSDSVKDIDVDNYFG
jgi:serine/threonine protein kinase